MNRIEAKQKIARSFVAVTLATALISGCAKPPKTEEQQTLETLGKTSIALFIVGAFNQTRIFLEGIGKSLPKIGGE